MLEPKSERLKSFNSHSPAFFFSFRFISYFLLSLCLVALVLPSFRSDPCLFLSLLTLLLLSFFSSWPVRLQASIKVFLILLATIFSTSLARVSRRLSLPPPSSHFHATHWAAMLCVFIAVCGRGGGLLSATNGLLENTDSYASPCGEVWGKQEKGKDLEGRLRESSF